jgi:hypothetical protein
MIVIVFSLSGNIDDYQGDEGQKKKDAFKNGLRQLYACPPETCFITLIFTAGPDTRRSMAETDALSNVDASRRRLASTVKV